MPNSNTSKTLQLLAKTFELEAPDEEISDEQLFQILADQIAYMIEFRMEYLLSLLYRNDVLEWKINEALSPANEDPANIALAKLVMERQQQRLATKEEYKVEPIEGIDEELKF